MPSKTEMKVIATDYKVSCKVCKRTFLDSGILKHISNTENCKLKYPKKDLSKLKTSSNSRNKMKDKARKCEVYDPDLRSEEYPKNRDKIALKYTSRKKEQEEKEIGVKDKQINAEKCKVCLRFFKDTSILNHIAKSNLCQKVYQSKSFQTEMHRLEKISVNRYEIKVANWNKKHKDER